MLEIGPHLIYIQIVPKVHSNDSKITWNQDNKLDFAYQIVQQPMIQPMRCHHHTTDAFTAQNSTALAQTAPKYEIMWVPISSIADSTCLHEGIVVN